MKKKASDVLLWVLLAASAIAAYAIVRITYEVFKIASSSEYDLLHVPILSWFVFGLSGLILTFAGIAFCIWRQARETSRELIGLTKQPLVDEIPAVCGHTHLDKAEFLTIIQILFRRPPDIRYIQVAPLPGGYGGSTTVLARLRREQDGTSLPRSFVVKLGDRREMADEHKKFQDHVRWWLTRAATFFRHAEWEDFAGIAYEFVGMDPGHEVQSFYQFYQGHTAAEISELTRQVYSLLGQAWHRRGQEGSANLYREYQLLSKKQKAITERVEKIVDEDDPYRDNFTIIEERLQPDLKPCFCPEMDIPWHDPVAFLQTWPKRELIVPVHRSVVHGDLHARNVLVETEENGQKHAWFIDFSHTGNGLSQARTKEASREGTLIDPNRGHTLRDFCRLEADVKFILTRLQDEEDLRLAVTFEKELMARGFVPDDLPATPPPVEAFADERFQKAWHVVAAIRHQAARYLIDESDPCPYYLSLLHATLPIVYYHREQFKNQVCELQQKRYALISAGMLCGQLEVRRTSQVRRTFPQPLSL